MGIQNLPGPPPSRAAVSKEVCTEHTICVKCGEILEACELAIHQELDCRAAYEAEEPPHKNNVASKWSLLFVNIISVELGI